MIDKSRQEALPIGHQRVLLLLLSVQEAIGAEGQIEWRGTLTNVDGGWKGTFEDWPELVDQIAEALRKLHPLLCECQLGEVLSEADLSTRYSA